jgi:hypothetical protein
MNHVQVGGGTQSDGLRSKYGFWVVVVGLAVVALVWTVAILNWKQASDVATAVGSVTGVVGTLVGAYFGVQVGAAGKEKAERDRDDAQDKVSKLAGALPPDVAERLLM